ncbi:MAG: hypothetical protein ABIK79_02390 [Chloroflexota bacterium]|nr:hypothetical protein [Anaerolineae bacterium]
MAGSFQNKPLKKASFADRALKRQPSENPVIEVNNLLAQAERLMDVSPEGVDHIGEKYEVDVRKKRRKGLTGLHKEHMSFCLERGVADEEIAELSHLEALFDLDEKAVKKARKECADGYLESIMADERITPEESERLDLAMSNLGMTIPKEMQSRFLRYQAYWEIENLDLPEIEAPVNLQRNEVCHFIHRADWLEHRAVTSRVSYSGPTARVKLAKGVYWRVGSVGVKSTSEETLKKIDSGVTYLTNKRLIFVGGHKTTSIQLSRILDFTPYQNGVEIQKDKGRNPFLVLEDADIFAMILARAIGSLN